MSNHNAESSKLYKQRLNSQQLIMEEMKKEMKVQLSAIIEIHTIATNDQDPSPQTTIDIANICDKLL